MEKEFKIIKAYQNNTELRNSFNSLAEKVFGLNFEAWYQGGYWRDTYIPYSVVDRERVVANVSVNLMDFMYEGRIRHFIQLGTVMTDEDYRNRGLIRQLMKVIEGDYENRTDGVYLFANDSVLEFYPRFGFHKAQEYQFTKTVGNHKERTAYRVEVHDRTQWRAIESFIGKSAPDGSFGMIHNTGLQMFHLTYFMKENIYYIEHLRTYVVAEADGTELVLYNVFSESEVDMDSVIESFGKEIQSVRYGFTPLHKDRCQIQAIQEEDLTLFAKGMVLDLIEKEPLMFPLLSHA